MEILFEVTIENYIRRVKIADKRRAKYYIKGANKPLIRHLQKDRKTLKDHLIWKKYNGKLVLFDTESKKKVVRNPRAAGEPRYKLINGQEIYSGNMHPAQRAK